MNESMAIKQLEWEIFRYCLPPGAFVIWHEHCKEPGWPKHRVGEFADTLFDMRFANLKMLFEKLGAEVMIPYLFTHAYDDGL